MHCLLKSVMLGCLLLSSLLHAFDKNVFFQRLQQPTPQWMLEQIQEDLAPFQNALISKNLDVVYQTYRKMACLVRVKVISGNLYVINDPKLNSHGAYSPMVDGIKQLHRLIPFPDLDILISLCDKILFSTEFPNETPLPILVAAKDKYDLGLILIPDWSALAGFEGTREQMLQSNRKYPWGKKIEKMFWRGSSTGIPVSGFQNWLDFPRSKLAFLSTQYPNYLDAKITGVHQKELADSFKQMGLIGNWVSLGAHGYYKYLIDIDGNSCTWPRCYCLLLSNSVMFKQVTNDIQWFYRCLRPYENFIPIKEDLSDLFEEFAWAKEHDEQCRTIANTSTQFAEEMLTQEAVYLYTYRLLEEYSRIYCQLRLEFPQEEKRRKKKKASRRSVKQESKLQEYNSTL